MFQNKPLFSPRPIFLMYMIAFLFVFLFAQISFADFKPTSEAKPMSERFFRHPVNLTNLQTVISMCYAQQGNDISQRAQVFDDFTLIGIRNTEQGVYSEARHTDQGILIADEFYNDTFVTLRANKYGAQTGQKIKVYQGTTDPGKHVRHYPYEGTSGTGAIVPGIQYLGIYELGKHGEFVALVQTNGYFWIYRDADKDQNLLLNLATIEKGYGFNFHRRRGDRVLVGQASGGCQVPLIEDDSEEIFSDVEKHNGGPRVSYVIVNSHWLTDMQAAEREISAIHARVKELTA